MTLDELLAVVGEWGWQRRSMVSQRTLLIRHVLDGKPYRIVTSGPKCDHMNDLSQIDLLTPFKTNV